MLRIAFENNISSYQIIFDVVLIFGVYVCGVTASAFNELGDCSKNKKDEKLKSVKWCKFFIQIKLSKHIQIFEREREVAENCIDEQDLASLMKFLFSIRNPFKFI